MGSFKGWILNITPLNDYTWKVTTRGQQDQLLPDLKHLQLTQFFILERRAVRRAISIINWAQTDQTHLQSTHFFMLPFLNWPCYIKVGEIQSYFYWLFQKNRRSWEISIADFWLLSTTAKIQLKPFIIQIVLLSIQLLYYYVVIFVLENTHSYWSN